MHVHIADGTGLEVYATGIRNSVGFDWHPETKDLWFTDNGFDRYGDNSPDDELNRASERGMSFGFPACYSQVWLTFLHFLYVGRI